MSSDNKDDGHWFHPDHSFWHQEDTSSYDGSSKILLITIVSFSILVLIVFAYHLYARFVLRYRVRSRSSTFQDHTLFFVSQPPKRGLDITVLASLPTFVVGDGHDVVECAVCLSLLKEKDIGRMLPSCKHVFHVTCVDTWLTTCSTCPVCRTEVEPSPKIEPEPREGPVGDGGASLFAVASSFDNKTDEPSVSRLDSFRRILTRERSLNRNDHSRVDQDLERQ